MATGHPYSSPNAMTSAGSVRMAVLRGRHDVDLLGGLAALILSPMTSIAAGGGPTNVTPRSVIARAKSAFSEKKP